MAQVKTPLSFTPYQKFVVALLAFIQFTIILDFMIISPLGAVLMPALAITPAQFGLVVSLYAFSAGISGFLTAGFADRFDRKKLLLFFYCGFILATLFCGTAPNYHWLLAARMMTGVFGGVLGSIVLAIATDLFPFEMRGRVMGFLQTAFAASQILGLPAGIYFSNHWGWHAPFIMIVSIATCVGIFAFRKMAPVDGHLKLKVDRHPLHHLLKTLSTPQYILGFSSTALLSIGGFMMMPFGSAFTVNNLGIPMEKLPLIYLVTGITSMFIGPIVGKLSDRFGKYPTLVFGSAVSIILVIYYTHMSTTPLVVVMVVNTLMFLGIFSRMIPSQALVASIPSPESRGAYMSVSSSLQQVAGGIGSIFAGMIVVQAQDGRIEHFDRLGFVMVGTTCMSVVMMFFVNRLVARKVARHDLAEVAIAHG